MNVAQSPIDLARLANIYAALGDRQKAAALSIVRSGRWTVGITFRCRRLPPEVFEAHLALAEEGVGARRPADLAELEKDPKQAECKGELA